MATTTHWLPNFSAACRTKSPVRDRGRIDRSLVGAGEQQGADVLRRPNPAANRQRHEADLGGAPHDVQQDAAVLVARRDVEEAEFVRARLVVGDGAFDRVARVAQIDEIDALDDAAVLDVEAGNEARFESHRTAPATRGAPPAAARNSASASRGSSRPS